MKITEAAPLIATAVGVWAVVNTVITFVAVINERRDTVITGCLAGTPLKPEHRHLIMNSDWIVMSGSMVLLLLGVGVFVLSLPTMFAGLVDAKNPARIIGLGEGAKRAMRFVGTGFVLAAVVWALTGYSDYSDMIAALGQAGQPTCKGV